jgi:hypothetical protein
VLQDQVGRRHDVAAVGAVGRHHHKPALLRPLSDRPKSLQIVVRSSPVQLPRPAARGRPDFGLSRDESRDIAAVASSRSGLHGAVARLCLELEGRHANWRSRTDLNLYAPNRAMATLG